jgi:hypothetical protein
LYNVPKAGNHWFKTYHNHYTKELSIEQSIYDPCLFYSLQLFGIVSIQTNNTFILSDSDFFWKKESELKKARLIAKDYEQLNANSDLKFNRGVIYLKDNRSIVFT